MMVFLAIVLVLVLVIAVVLGQKLKISYELTAENFNISFAAKISWFGKTLFDSSVKQGKPAEEKNEDMPAEKKKNKRKMSLSDIGIIKDAVVAAVPAVFKILKKSVRLDAFETDIRLALADPMDNGIAYGAVCGAVNNIYAGLMRIYPGKEYFLDINHDFKSGDGLILENKGKLYIRPGKVLFWVLAVFISNKKLRKALLNIKKLFTKEETK